MSFRRHAPHLEIVSGEPDTGAPQLGRPLMSHVRLELPAHLHRFSDHGMVTVPLGLVMDRSTWCTDRVPDRRGTATDPAVPRCAMFRSCCGRRRTRRASSSSRFLGSFFPILLFDALHGMTMVDPVLVRAAQCLGAAPEASILRRSIPGDAALCSRVRRGHRSRLGVADRRRDDLGGPGLLALRPHLPHAG